MERGHGSSVGCACGSGEPDGAGLGQGAGGPPDALARAAREAGHRLALLSNSFGLDPFNPYEHVGICDLFDAHVISELVGMAKPDPAIYELALDRIGLPGERCVFVDDHAVNLPPAAELGIATVHVTDEDTAVAELEALLGVTAVVAA
ncbi:haloacid dehalogenase [Streptomyces gardneri]|nr:haloacid dehalogenase [Streptomyces gardneri]